MALGNSTHFLMGTSPYFGCGDFRREAVENGRVTAGAAFHPGWPLVVGQEMFSQQANIEATLPLYTRVGRLEKIDDLI